MGLPIASVQLYTLASEFTDDMQGSLDRLAGIGLTTVEAFDFVGRPAQIRAAFAASGIAASTGHAPLLSDELWTPDGAIPTPGNDVVFAAAAEIGLTTVFDPFVAPERWLTEDGVADIAERLNRAADAAAAYGLTVGYHNHAQEFLASFGGQSAYERFVELTDDRVQLELDLFWAQTGGQDPTALAARLGRRLSAVHVKDGIVPAVNPWGPDGADFSSDSLDQRHPGTGEVPLAEALRANPHIGYAVIEYDHTPGDVFTDVAASFAFLRDGGFVA